MDTDNMGTIALREVAGESPTTLVDIPMTVTLRESDFQVIQVEDPQTGQPMSAPATAKIQFETKRWRELTLNGEPCGIFEFYVAAPAPPGSEATAKAYVSGADILHVRVLSKLI